MSIPPKKLAGRIPPSDSTRLKQDISQLQKGAKIIQGADSGDQDAASNMVREAAAKQDTLTAIRTIVHGGTGPQSTPHAQAVQSQIKQHMDGQ